MNLTGQKIVYASTNHSWAYGWTFYQMLAEALAAQNDVVYVDPATSIARLRPADARLLLAADVRRVGPRLSVFRSPTIPMQRSDVLRKAAASATARSLAAWARRSDFDPDIIWTYAPQELAIAKRFPNAKLVYWTADEVILAGEEELLDRADAILCASVPTFERHRAAYGDRAHLVWAACDYERYHAQLQKPVDADLLHGLQRPVFGYAGWLNERVDDELLEELADAMAVGTLLLAGPGDAAARLDGRENVRILGPQSADRVPAVMQAFDVALIPYRDTAFNRSSNPVKFYEYLALGKYVVTTDIPTLRQFADVASVGDWESFVERALGAAERASTAEAAFAVARAHSFPALLEVLRELPS